MGRPRGLEASTIIRSSVMRHTSSAAAAHQSPDHLPTFTISRAAPSSATSSLFLLDVIPTIRHQSGSSQKAHIAGSHIKDDTSRGTKDQAEQLPMWHREWHLWRYCPLQFVINHPMPQTYFCEPPQFELFIQFFKQLKWFQSGLCQ